MTSAGIFLAWMYLHLACSVAFPVALLAVGEWNDLTWSLFLGYLLEVVLLQVWGWVTVMLAVIAHRRGNAQKLQKGWVLLKLGSVPFFLMNFAYSCVFWFVIVVGSRGILGIFLPIPVAVTCLMILQTGCVGCCQVRQIRRKIPSLGGRHYLFQLLPVADVFDTIYLLKRDKTTVPKE